jgi:hypothetical protein
MDAITKAYGGSHQEENVDELLASTVRKQMSSFRPIRMRWTWLEKSADEAPIVAP